MTKPKEEVPPLVRAAQRIEDNLRKLEELAASVGKMRLHTEKNITRAARELATALEQPAELSEGLRQMADAMAGAQQRQQAVLAALGPIAENIQRRSESYQEHIKRFAALGELSRSTTDLMQSALDAGTAEDEAFRLDVERRLTELVDGAKALADSAKANDLTEVERDADSLRQRLQSIRGRLKVDTAN